MVIGQAAQRIKLLLLFLLPRCTISTVAHLLFPQRGLGRVVEPVEPLRRQGEGRDLVKLVLTSVVPTVTRGGGRRGGGY